MSESCRFTPKEEDMLERLKPEMMDIPARMELKEGE